MYMIRSLLLMLLSIYSAGALAQTGKSAPFVVDEEGLTATLKIKGSPLIEKYAAVFQKHHLDAASPVDWNGLIEQIVGMKDTDLYIGGELSFDMNDDAVEITATSKESLQRLIKVVQPVLAS